MSKKGPQLTFDTGIALDLVPVESLAVQTPTGLTYNGARQTSPVCGVSILRAGASFENVLRKAYG